MMRYAGQLDYWIVVNEGINVYDGNQDELANSVWLSSIGNDYIVQAFAAARAADPTATLLYNDFGTEEVVPQCAQKREAILALLSSLKQAGLVDAFGAQSHLSLANQYDPASYKSFLDAIYALGLEIFVTELDVNDQSAPADIPTRDALVAGRYTAFLQTVLRHPGVRSVNVWGLSDNHSWLQATSPRPDGLPLRPCLLDSNLVPKQAYFAAQAALISSQTVIC